VGGSGPPRPSFGQLPGYAIAQTRHWIAKKILLGPESNLEPFADLDTQHLASMDVELRSKLLNCRSARSVPVTVRHRKPSVRLRVPPRSKGTDAEYSSKKHSLGGSCGAVK